MFANRTGRELLLDSSSSGSFTTEGEGDLSTCTKPETSMSEEAEEEEDPSSDEEVDDDYEEDEDDEEEDEDDDDASSEDSDEETECESLPDPPAGRKQDIFKAVPKSPLSISENRDRYDATFAHSFASDATEERAHVSSPRAAAASPRKRQQQQPPGALPGTVGGSLHGQVPLTPPTAARLPGAEGFVPSPGLSTISGVSSPPHHHHPPAAAAARGARRVRDRVPGGGAAKLLGRRDGEGDYNNVRVVRDGDDALEVVAPVDELARSRERAKAEFTTGPADNRRYRPAPQCDVSVASDLPSEASLPSILNRSEVFHENAAAAIVSLLSTPVTPTDVNVKSRGGSYPLAALSPDISEILSSRSGEMQGHRSPNGKTTAQTTNPFHPPRRAVDEAASVVSVRSDVSSAVMDAAESASMTGKSPLVQHLLSKKAERRLEAIKGRMKDPSKNLAALMAAIASPSDGEEFDRHDMVRRKNACGALQVLTANSFHRVNICWTLGVLPALAAVLEDSGPGALEDAYPDVDTRREFVEARKRAVSALMNLAVPQDNKLPIFHCPKLVASLIRVIDQDEGESGRGCCAVLAHMAKSKENRLLMAQVPGLVDAVAAVIAPKSRTFSNGDMESESYGDDVLDRNASDDGDDGEYNAAGDKMRTRKVPSEDPAEASARYDEDPNEFLHGARQNVFALLMNLVKEKDNAFILARHVYLLDTLVAITKLQESSSQEFGLKLLAHLSRHRANSKLMVFKKKATVPALVLATHSESAESRKYACFALQNLSQDKPCRQELASVESLLPSLCRRIRSARDPEERLAALHALKNLTDEPANLIPMTNTPECFATIMQIAHASDESVTETMQYLGCDALATLSHWFRSIATSGQRIGTDKRNDESAKDHLFVPTLKVIAWQPWQ